MVIQMNKQDYINELNNAFKDFKFFEQDHHYEFKGETIGMSVTRLIEEYVNEFDSEAIAEKVAQRDGKTIQDVLNEWKLKNEQSLEKGHLGHLYAQSLWSGELYQEPKNGRIWGISASLEVIKQQANNFYQDFKDKFEHIADEFVVGSEEFDIASCIDHLFYNKLI